MGLRAWLWGAQGRRSGQLCLFPCGMGREQRKAAKRVRTHQGGKNVKGSPVTFIQHVINSQQKMPRIHNGSRQRGRKALTSMRFLGVVFFFLI